MKIKVLFLIAAVFCLAQISFGQVNDGETQIAQGYLLGPGDVVEGKVLGEEQFNFISTVDDDGKIQVPFFDQGVTAKCKTEKELKAEVAKLLSKYLKNPQLSVRVTDRKSRPPVSVSGEVKKAGPVMLTRETRLLELITFAEGPTDDSSGMIQVFRAKPPVCTEVEKNNSWKDATDNILNVPSRLYSLTSVLQGREESNPIIYPGDLIVVQKAAPIYITGEVRQATGMYLKEGGLSLSQAIAMVGGVNREARTKQIKIYRLKANSKERDVIVANYDAIKKGTQKDPMLEPYDIIEVDKAKENIGQTILKMAIGMGKTIVSQGTSSLSYRVLY
jgi:polysaccharide export outer membrane protein